MPSAVLSFCSDSHTQEERYDEFDAVADYVFQVIHLPLWQLLLGR